MALIPCSSHAVNQGSMNLITSLFFSPETATQVRQKRITELKKLIPRLTIQVDAAKKVWDEALAALSIAYTSERTKNTSYENQKLVCRLHCKQFRDIALNTLPEDMCSEVNLNGPNKDEYDRKMDESIDLVMAQLKVLFPEGKDCPKLLKRKYKLAHKTAEAVYNVQKTRADGYESEYQQIELELRKAKSELSRLQASIAQEASVTVFEIINEFETA